MELAVGDAPGANDLVSAGATWRYLDDGSDQGTAWRASDFDDSGWSSGAAELGFGDRDETTVITSGHITYYFRHAFDVADTTVIVGLTLSIVRDDGAVVYLNGTEIYRTNMPDGDVTSSTLASGAVGGSDESTYEVVELTADHLLDGQNVLAVEVHQSSAGSSDVSFNLELVKVPAALGTPTSVTISSDLESMLFVNITADDDAEGEETVGLTLSDPSTGNAVVGGTNEHRVSDCGRRGPTEPIHFHLSG